MDMRKLLSIFALCALALVACEEPKTQEPQEAPQIEFQITSDTTVEVAAEGGNVVVKYAITNPDASLSVSYDVDAAWIAKSEALDAAENEICFVVEANESETPRRATITLSYATFSGNVVVEQKGAEVVLPDVPSDAVELPYLSAVYFGNMYGATENDYNYSVALATHPNVIDIVTGDLNIVEEQVYLFLDLFSSVPSEGYNVEFNIPVGTYEFDINDTCKAGTVGAYNTFYYNTMDYSLDVYPEVFFVEGSVVVEKNLITAELVGEDGVTYKFACRSNHVDNHDNFFGDWIYHGEYFTCLTEDKVLNLESARIKALCWDDYYVVGKNYWMLSISGVDNEAYTTLTLGILNSFEDEYPVGEFSVASDLHLEQMVLPGFINGHGILDWSWLSWEDGEAPIVDGAITIVDNGDNVLTIVLDLIDDAGYKITGECTAELEISAF